MSFKDTIIDIFNQGPDDWRARLGESILLDSPDGDEHETKWRGDSRTFSKKLGVFVYPRVRGNVVQDLDVNSTHYSIPLHFDGPDCDIKAQAFFLSAKQRGVWTVTHPTYGILDLQLMTITENNEPITSGGIITVETEWIEPIDESTLLTAAELAAEINDGIDDLNDSALEQFYDGLNDGTEALRAGIDEYVDGVANVTDALLGPLSATVDAVNDSMLAIQNGIQDTLNATVLQVRSLGGQMQALAQTPLLASNDVDSRLDYYKDLEDALIADLPSVISANNKNKTVIYELSLLAGTAGNSKIAVTGVTGSQNVTTSLTIQTRPQAVEAAIRIADSFSALTDALDSIQENFETENIDDQYFAQNQSYADAAKLVGKTVQYLLLSSFDLAVERRFTLEKPSSPIALTVSEYGTLGENDANLELFISSNNLKGKDIYLLPAGREVLVYV